MIVRILGEAQRDLPDTALEELNALDRIAEQAVDAGDQAAFTAALHDLLAAVRQRGTPVADEVLVPSDLVLPPPDATVDEVRALFDGDGLVPG
ncbi:MAG: hypothetical protein WD794_12455 [Mycobacteriales bacterium]